MLYALVYGPEWEDICYFSCLQKAKRKLVFQAQPSIANHFHSCIYEYSDDLNGVFKPTDRYFIVDHDVLYDMLSQTSIGDIIKNDVNVDRLVKTMNS